MTGRRLGLQGPGREHRSERGERGETLIELAATIVLMGFAVVTVVGLIFTVTKITGMHRSTTTANTWVHNIGEAYINPVETPYQHCVNDYAVPTLPTGYSADVTSVERLADPADPEAEWVAMGVGCVDDGGVQRITIEAWSSSSPEQREVLQVVKRDTGCLATPAEEDC